MLYPKFVSLIRKTDFFPAYESNGKLILLFCGYGGRLWHTKRLVKVLNKLGYDVRAYEFLDMLFNDGDPQHLIKLAKEMTSVTEQQSAAHEGETILIGISVGVLMALNVLRRSNSVTKAIGYTGGDIVKAIRNSFPKKWKQADNVLYDALAEVNMFSDPELLRDKKIVFILPTHDKYIDPLEVRAEIQKQIDAGNDFTMLETKPFGHIGTIINETVVHPKRVIAYLRLAGENV